MKEFKKAFTLAEVLVVMVIIAVLAIFILYSMANSAPDRNKAMFKKAYSVAERTIGELVNDESLYPYKDLETIGFLNTEEVDLPLGEKAGGKGSAGNQKFCKLFASKLNLLGELQYGFTKGKFGEVKGEGHNAKMTSGPVCYFETSDGVAWLVPQKDTTDASLYPLRIFVDVNGTDKAPNTDNNQEDRDIYAILFWPDGRVGVPEGGKEAEFLKSHSVNKDK